VVVPENNDATIRSWALNTSMSGQLNPLSTYLGYTGPVRTMAYARMGNSKRIVSGSGDAEIGIWDRDSGRLVRKRCGHEAAILSISVSDDKLFSGSKDKTLRVWDLTPETIFPLSVVIRYLSTQSRYRKTEIRLCRPRTMEA
jgi:WD40 repeat protein